MRTRTERNNHHGRAACAVDSSAGPATAGTALRDPLLDAILAALRACPIEQAREVIGFLSEHSPTAFGTREPPLLDVAGAAERLGKHPKTIERWCREGRVAGARKVGATWRLSDEGLGHVGRSEPSRVTSAGPARRRHRQVTERRRGSLLVAAPKAKSGSRAIAGANVQGAGGHKGMEQKQRVDSTPVAAQAGGRGR